MIVADRLKKYYGKNCGVENVSFSIAPGEIYGLIGPNGAGKTTTIRIILGLLKMDSGSVSIGGVGVPEDLEKVKSSIGYLPGEVNFYGEMRVKEFLKFNRGFYSQDLQESEDELVEYLAIDREKKFKELSQGNKKKVGILQALVHHPKYLILDEPTNGLDPLLQNKLYQLLERERNGGATILFSSHVLSEVERLCQRVGVVRNGELVKELSMEDVREIAVRKITVTGYKDLSSLDGYNSTYSDESSRVYSVRNSELNGFLKKLTALEYTDVEIKRPPLEETFMEIYGGGEQE